MSITGTDRIELRSTWMHQARSQMEGWVRTRQAQKEAAMHRVLTIGIVLVVIGSVLATVGLLVMRGLPYLRRPLFVIGFLCIVCGIMTAATCPPDLLDVDNLLKQRPTLRVSFGLALALLTVTLASAMNNYVNLLRLLPLLPMMGGYVHADREPRATTLVVCWIELAFVALLANSFTRVLRPGISARHRRVEFCVGCFAPIVMALIGLVWWWQRRRHLLSAGQEGAGPTLAMYQAMYSCLLSMGLVSFGKGLAGTLPPMFIGLGVVMSLPVLVLFVLRKDMYCFMERKYMQGQVLQDGAFLAVLSMSHLKLGQDLWIERSQPHTLYPPSDHRRNFRKGQVLSLLSQEGVNVVEWKEEGRDCRPQVMSCNASCYGDLSVEELSKVVQENLRCTNYESVARQLRLPHPDKSYAALSEQSWPTKQRIDYFVSYCWEDMRNYREQHLHRLRELVAKFYKRHGRPPTFWFDKVCMLTRSKDMANEDALKLLPGNVMACKKLLLLCGPSFSSRLWCIWELFVRNCFAENLEQSLEEIEIVSCMALGNHQEVMRQLLNFDYTRASCYDPNEQRRLHETIRAIDGQASMTDGRFNTRVRQIAKSYLGSMPCDANTKLYSSV